MLIEPAAAGSFYRPRDMSRAEAGSGGKKGEKGLFPRELTAISLLGRKNDDTMDDDQF